jgi:hypothetical protein
MNVTDNKTDDYNYYSLEYILTNFAGSTWSVDSFNFWPFVTLGPIAILLNALACLVLRNPKFNINLYAYLRIYTANNTILASLVTFQWVNCCIRIMPWTNSYLGQAICIYSVCNAANLFYFFGSVIDLFMLLDRIGIFKKEIKKYLKLSPYKVCGIAFVCVLVIEIPAFLVLTVSSESFKLNATVSYTVWFNHNSEFANSVIGAVLIYVIDVIRDLLVGLVQILLNVALIIYFKQYMDKKRLIMHDSALAPSMSDRTTATQQQNSTTGNAQGNKLVAGQQDRVSRADRRATFMCILMCVLSTIEHLLVLASILYPYFGSSYLILLVVYSCSFLWQILKRIADFFILFFVNKVFKQACLEFLGIK